MRLLSKLLKPGFLRSFLADGLATMGQGGFLAIVEAGKVLASAGPVPEDVAVLAPPLSVFPLAGRDRPQPVQFDHGLALPLTLEGAHLAILLLGAPDVGDEAGRARLAGVGRFVARSLTELLQREHLRRTLGEETLEQYRVVALTQRAVISLNRSMKLQDVVASLLMECGQANFPADHGLVLFLDGRVETYSREGAVAPLEALDLRKLTQSRLIRDIVAGNKGEIVNDLGADPRWEDDVPRVRSLLVIPLRGSRMNLGALVLVGMDEEHPFRAAHLKKMSTLASVAGIAMANAHHFEQTQQILVALIKAMATAIDARDRMTAGHSQRVAQYALGLARAANRDTSLCPHVSFSESDMQEIFYAGLLHDVGKIGVREEVLTKATRLPRPHLELIGLRLALWGELNGVDWKEAYGRLEMINKAYDLGPDDKSILDRFVSERLEVAGTTIPLLTGEERQRFLTPRGNLTPEEWLEIKRHPEESIRILENIPLTNYFPNMLTMILQHHERLDGSGYPYGISGDAIVVQSRIMAIVDIYDALRQDRHYKKGLSQDMALDILREEARRATLDVRLVELFCQDIDAIEQTVTAGITLLPVRGHNNQG